MNDNNKTTFGINFGFGGVLFIVFLILKLTHVIDWSWWWITAPLWIPLALSVVIILIVAIVSAITDRY